ncbi:type II toxin-antitoxin system RelE/ParE family toxin [Flavobacterium foetidum]|uniref:type II toxin-antitoxin system RelE/ParE family toxin n=1 Tax=Flavobacterium foetidum TaxID=2026681 RepID=UPI0010754C75|nr:type II toxin-antitoxin system RelE/ParE family toxin [Flavobacterium foetidum]KAF2518023.1 type II toxin-antitoxin system RelE/ParE family toxin [Flavobacterium foetidum]
MDKFLKVIWTNSAKNELKTIYNYYKEKSVQGANNIKNEILDATKKIRFSEQYQKDEIELEYRRIIIKGL